MLVFFRTLIKRFYADSSKPYYWLKLCMFVCVRACAREDEPLTYVRVEVLLSLVIPGRLLEGRDKPVRRYTGSRTQADVVVPPCSCDEERLRGGRDGTG